MPPTEYKPEIIDAMTRMDKALGSPRFPKFPLIDAMYALAFYVGHYERFMKREALSAWHNIEAGYAMIPSEEHGTSSLRTPIPINVELAMKAMREQVAAAPVIDPEIWLNLFANVLGQLCALQGIETQTFEASIESAFRNEDHIASEHFQAMFPTETAEA